MREEVFGVSIATEDGDKMRAMCFVLFVDVRSHALPKKEDQ